MMWIDTTLAGLMSGLQFMVGDKRFNLALQSEGRKSVEADWEVFKNSVNFEEGFKAIANIAAVAGWGQWKLMLMDEKNKLCRFQVRDSWEGLYQKALEVCWGSGMVAGKMAGYCSKHFKTNCWAEQTKFIADGDEYDEFIVRPSDRTIEEEIEKLLSTDEATKADMAVALTKLRNEIKERTRVEESLLKSERKLKESEEKYRRLSENANDIIMVLNNEFEFEYLNEIPLYKTVGYSSDELIGSSPTKIIHPDDIYSTIIAFREAYEKGEATVESRIKHKEGNYIWIESKGKNFFDKNQKKVLVISRDITERKKAELELKQSEKRFREAYNRAEIYKDLFAHDINNILQSILLSNQLIKDLLKDIKLSPEIDETMKIIKEQVDRGAMLVNNVRKLSQLEENGIKIESVDLKNFLDESIQFLKNNFPHRKINIVFNIADEHLHVQANKLILDVFENILINAVKHNIAPIVEILIKLTKFEDTNKKYIKIEFLDNGLGIEDKRKATIFQRVYEDTKSFSGMGLGLSLVKKIIESYNGKIWVEDKINGNYTKGSNFILIIPEAS